MYPLISEFNVIYKTWIVLKCNDKNDLNTNTTKIYLNSIRKLPMTCYNS